MKLAPVAPPPIPTAADKLPGIAGKLKAPKGFNVEVYAGGVPNARSLREGDKGTVFVGSRLQDKVHALVDKGGKREVKVIASGLHRPNGLAFKDGTLYIAELSKVSKIEKIEDNLDSPPKPTVIYDRPAEGRAARLEIHRHRAGQQALRSDRPALQHLPGPRHAWADPPHQPRRQRRGGDCARRAQHGRVRLASGVEAALFHRQRTRLGVGRLCPRTSSTASPRPVEHFGFPFCHQGDFLDPEFGWGRSCDEFTKPVAKMGPHTAALGMRFYSGNMFPAKYKNAIFVARHGSWNRTVKQGGDILAVFLNKDGSVKGTEVFISGFLENNSYVGRPVDVVFLKDGSMLISDDFNGAVWRVTYGNQKSAAKK